MVKLASEVAGEREQARIRMARFRASPDYAAWRERTREQRRAYKAAKRREAGVMTVAERKAATEARKAAQWAEKASAKGQAKHDAHVRTWRRSCPGASWAHRYHTDPSFRQRELLRARERRHAVLDADLQQHFASNLNRGRFPDGWHERLGYGADEAAEHLRKCMPRGASWAQFVEGRLQVNHITPRSLFDLSREDEVRACWSLANLQLLPAEASVRRGAKRTHLL